MGLMLADLVPERREQLEARAAEFARQRMVCGVHFPSDVRAGEIAARLLLAQLEQQPGFQRDAARAALELREARPARPER
jgi:acid phosphatase (class A)